MKGRLISGVVAATLLSAAAAPIGCGYLLYPERRGNSGGTIDGGIMVMDLLWLIPGIVPGVIALVVDFSSGAVYTHSHGRHAVLISPKGHVAVRVPASAKPMQLEFRLVKADHTVLARRAVHVRPNVDVQTVEIQFGAVTSHRNEKIYLDVQSANCTTRFPTTMDVAR